MTNWSTHRECSLLQDFQAKHSLQLGIIATCCYLRPRFCWTQISHQDFSALTFLCVKEGGLMGTPRSNIVSQRFGRWTVLKYLGRINQASAWLCRCDCGVVANVRLYDLKHGRSKSCGCLSRQQTVKRNRQLQKHGHANKGEISRLYRIWREMKQRCLCPNHDSYHNEAGESK